MLIQQVALAIQAEKELRIHAAIARQAMLQNLKRKPRRSLMTRLRSALRPGTSQTRSDVPARVSMAAGAVASAARQDVSKRATKECQTVTAR